MDIYHLYSDGNYFPRAKKSGFGGYIEDSNGQVVVEYTEQIKQIQYAHSFELLGIIRGLQIAKDRGIIHLISHCDDKNTAQRLKEIFEQNINKVTPQAKPELYDKIIDLSTSFKSIRFEYIPRAQNKYADSLSRRYASLMEDNFLKHYEQELDLAQDKFANNNKNSKRIFFSHQNLVRNSNKNNPYLVAQYRNKKIRKVSRIEEKKDYQYLYIETFSQNEETFYRGFFYDKNQQLNKTKESKFKTNDNHIENFCSFLSSCLDYTNHDKIWIYSNHRGINSYFEQKEKITQEKFDTFHQIYQKMNKFSDIFFHHFPFKHKFSAEIEIKEIKKEKLNINISNLNLIMDQLSQGILGKEQNKCFGNLIRYQLRNYRIDLKRELDSVEKNEIIETTAARLTEMGFKGLPTKLTSHF